MLKFLKEDLERKIEERERRCKSISRSIGENGVELFKDCMPENTIHDLNIIVVLNAEIRTLKQTIEKMELMEMYKK